MQHRVYYNEFDPFPAAWSRELMADGLIAPGDMDERDIRDVPPSELVGYRQWHLFSGIGIWSAALRAGGWVDSREVLTVSCPCQPFSDAGKGAGFADERHLWPAAFHLIQQLRPAVIFGEQVASKDGRAWLDLVLADLEAAAYTVWPVVTCACGFGAPHIRHRIYFCGVAQGDANIPRLEGRRGVPECGDECPAGQGGLAGGLAHSRSEGEGRRGIQRPRQGDGEGTGMSQQRPAGFCPDVGLADADHNGASSTTERGGAGSTAETGRPGRDAETIGRTETGCDAGRMAYAADLSPSEGRLQRIGEQRLHAQGGCGDGTTGHGERTEADRDTELRPSPTNGLWADPDWLLCRDGKWRPTEPAIFPLADAGTVSNRVGLLRGAGNALCIAQAQAFIESVMEVLS